MARVKITLIFCLIAVYTAFGQEYFPGGVAGAEMWYKVSHDDLQNGEYPNNAGYLRLGSCPDFSYSPELFNFNPSISTEGLCLMYNAPLENSTSRNIFFVGKPKEMEDTKFSHVITGWDLGMLPAPDSLIRNNFKLSTAYVNWNKRSFEYNSSPPEAINFYRWNIYNSDKRFKSYGLYGETTFYIGKNFTVDDVNAIDYNGNFPEYISFPFELTYNQKQCNFRSKR